MPVMSDAHWWQPAVRGALRTARAWASDAKPELAISRLARSDPRWPLFQSAVEYINVERVAGDIIECGVFTGVSLALLAHARQEQATDLPRRIVGFDAFEGLPPSRDEHPLWATGTFSVNAWDHPVLPIGARATPQATRDLFALCGLPAPVLEVGWFADTLRRAPCSAIALLHVDCDLYESTVDVLNGVAPVLQDGTMVLFDDWFLFKGNPTKGEARAFGEFLVAHPEWQAIPYRTYGTCCRAFILSRR
jgi:O-methyltransferase